MASTVVESNSNPSANRAMLLTAPGTAALAVVRICGDGVQPFLAAHFSKPVASNRCVHGELRDNLGKIIDDPVIVLNDAKNIADINLHGGAWVVSECLRLAQANGFEIVDSLHAQDHVAYEIEREMLAALPLARTELGVRMLLAQPTAWRNITHDVARAAIDDGTLHWLLNPPRVAIVGIPNVGKSTLANRLFGQAKSITAHFPGTTRDWVGDFANIDGLPVLLVDTPGQHETSDTIERAAIELSQSQITSADLTIVVFDPTQPMPPQRDILQRFENAIVVLNKSDLHDWDAAENGIRISATQDIGITDLRRAIRDRFIKSDALTARWWTATQRTRMQNMLE